VHGIPDFGLHPDLPRATRTRTFRVRRRVQVGFGLGREDSADGAIPLRALVAARDRFDLDDVVAHGVRRPAGAVLFLNTCNIRRASNKILFSE
jgi:hypothetical protein